jgi:hypothetical protein
MSIKINKKTCGLCGATKNLIKTQCCDNWICDDADKYVIFSYAKNSCYRNHDRFTICAAHYHSNHKGKWQDCNLCKDDYPIENYVDYATNEFNFEKLQNVPKITITCINCGFQSGTVQDFALQINNDFYCAKNKCQKEAMAPLSSI